MFHDLRQAVRTLSKHPAFLGFATVVLALGIGLNTALFSIVRALLFTPFPVPASDELVSIYQILPRQPDRPMVLGSPQFEFLDRYNEVFTALTAQWNIGSSLRADERTEAINLGWVRSNYFDVLGVTPVLGRALLPSEDDVANPARAVVISHDLWLRRFESDPAIVGRVVDLGLWGETYTSYTVVGVMPAGFRGVSEPWKPAHAWVTFAQSRGEPTTMWSGVVIGRLRRGLTVEQARAVVAAQGRQHYAAQPRPDPRYEPRLTVLPTNSVRTPQWPSDAVIPKRLAGALTIVVAMVLLVAAANIAGLLLARGIGRSTEIAIRRALGAGSHRIVRQLLVESVVLAVIGGAGGLLLARLLVDLFRVLTPVQFMLDVTIDGAVLFYTIGISVAAGVIVGVLPARQAGSFDILPWLAGGDNFQTMRTRSATRHTITIPQVAISLVLLLTAGVYVRDLLRVELADLGYQPRNLLVGYPSLRTSPEDRLNRRMPPDLRKNLEGRYAARTRLFYDRLYERLRAIPGTTDVAITNWLPLREPAERPDWTAIADEGGADAEQGAPAQRASVSPGYCATMGISIVAGRDFDARDARNLPRVAVVSAGLARRVWPGRDPIGRSVKLVNTWNPGEKPEVFQVIGVASEVSPVLHDREPRPFIYLAMSQDWRPSAATVLIRGTGDSRMLTALVKDAVSRADGFAELYRATTMTELVTEIMYPRRVAGAVLAVSGLLTLFLATIGVYGVVSYAVAQRRGEIAVRMALGAERRDIVRLVLRDGATIAAWGSVAGVALGYTAIRLTSSRYLALPSLDLATMILMPVLLTVIILLACYLPARDAGGSDPLRVLRRT